MSKIAQVRPKRPTAFWVIPAFVPPERHILQDSSPFSLSRKRLREPSRHGAPACGAGMEKIVEQGLLYDFYGQLLTNHQQKVYEQAVYENLSYNEIAGQEGISRQAVHDLIRRTTALMQRYEDRLGMIRRFRNLSGAADLLSEAADSAVSREELAARVREIADRIRKDLS